MELVSWRQERRRGLFPSRATLHLESVKGGRSSSHSMRGPSLMWLMSASTAVPGVPVLSLPILDT